MKLSALITKLQDASVLLGDVDVHMAHETNPTSIELEIPIGAVSPRCGLKSRVILSELPL